ncbi:cell division protein FtsK [Pasteurellaceae bacterium RH1A]|nr:cell division protein FtsK [Pasteurellaceae bacterium RH1A]
MIEKLTGKNHFIKFSLLLISLFGLYLTLAWLSYSPLDRGWTVASDATSSVLNRTGAFGAWAIDLLYAMLGKVAFLVPLLMAGLPLYWLVFKRPHYSGLQCLLRLLSFTSLIVGLAGLSAGILSPTPYYLSGGFIGGIFIASLEGLIGLFGALLVAMILTCLGFYFCSGASLLLLGNKLYQWVMADPKTAAQESQAPQQAVENPQILANEKEENEEEETSPDQALTDVSRFSRPNIIGLKTEEPEPTGLIAPEVFLNETKNIQLEPSSLPQVNLAGTKPLVEQVESEPQALVLPTIRLNTQANPLAPVESTDENEEVKVEQVVVPPQPERVPDFTNPHIKLNQPAFVEEVQELSEEEQEAELARQFQEAEAARLREMEARAKAQGLDDAFQTILQAPEEFEAPKVKLAPAAEPAKNPPKQTAYPTQGYGDTLIHPLLQQHKKLEKPSTPLPTLNLLKQAPAQSQLITEQEIRETSQRIEQELANFGVKATVEDVLVGPVVTRYEIQPAAGTKASKIMNLDQDLARALVFKAIRITEVVPGKPYMGIETPNAHRETVWLRDVLDSPEFRNTTATLPMALGKDISGKPVVVDMAKMPHLLVAGQTGGGKSVGVNTMILSLLYKLSPEQVRFIMIDPKVVELSIYDDIPHLLTPVVTDMKQAANALRWAVEEMERRYQLLKHLAVRNIEGYNDKIDQAEAMNYPIPNPLWRPGDSMDSFPPPLEKLSYIVLIVDEFADLMMTAGKQVEEHIMRIAQKARAVGIHLILATQRPSTDVITGVIKANIPSRIAFTVSSQIDSRTILDKGGAESLLGRGDMLYSGASSPEIIRVHGAFMSDEDVQKVADDWRARGKPNYLDSITASSEEGEGSDGRNQGGDLDPLFDEIVEFVVESNVTSISGIQRRFSLGFNRAARIIDQMEAEGVISSADSRGKREVLAR